MYKKYERFFKPQCNEILDLIESESMCGSLNTKDGIYLYEAIIKLDVEFARFSEIFDEIKNKLYDSNSIDNFINILNNSFYNDKIEFKHINNNKDSYAIMGKFNIQDGVITIFILNKIGVLQQYKNDDYYEDFINEVNTLLGHELIHRLSSLKIKYENIKKKIYKGLSAPKNINEWRKYLSQKHEIMSYSWQIVNNFRLHGITDATIKKILSMKDTQSNIKYTLGGNIFEDYHRIFNINDEPLKLLYKYMYMYLD